MENRAYALHRRTYFSWSRLDLYLGLILVSVIFLVIRRWSDYRDCKHPLGEWQVIMWGVLFFMRLLLHATQRLAYTSWHACAFGMTLALGFICIPLIAVWSVLGAYWYADAHACLDIE